MYYVITKINDNPTFVSDLEGMAMPFESEKEAENAATEQPLCKVFGFAIFNSDNWTLSI